MARRNDLDIDFSYHIKQNYYEDGYVDYDINLNSLESEVYEKLESNLEGFNESVLEKINFDTSAIVSDLDLEGMATSYLENYEPDYRGNSNEDYHIQSYHDNIDAIFER